jgi:hypothetical protein
MLQPQELILNPSPDDPKHATGQTSVTIREDLDPKALVVTAGDPAFAFRADPPGQRTFQLTVDWTAHGKKTPTESVLRFDVAGEVVTLPVRVNLARVEPPKDAPGKP